MTFNNLCELYENACLDYEVSVLTEGADSEEAKTAEAKKTGLASKIFASIGAAFEKLGQMIMRILTFIKRRFVRDKVKLVHGITITPASTYKKFLSDITNYALGVDDEGNMRLKYQSVNDRYSPLEFTATPYGPGTVIDKTSYQEVLEKAKRLTSKYEQLKNKAVDIKKKYHNDDQKYEPASVDALAYRFILKSLSSLTTRINSDMKEISNNAVPEDVAPANDKKGKADTNNESTMFDGLTRNELRAKLLIEAADLLNEGAARNERKKIIRDIKLSKKTEEMKSFLKGTMDKEDAKKYYNELMTSFSEIENKIMSIPKETVNDKFLGLMKFSVTPVGILIGVVSSALTSKLDSKFISGITSGISIGSYIGLSRVEKPDGTVEYNFNKKYAMNKLSKLKNKVMSVYSKKYED